MLIVCAGDQRMTVRIRAQAAAARQRERRIAALYGMSRELASVRGVDGLLRDRPAAHRGGLPGRSRCCFPMRADACSRDARRPEEIGDGSDRPGRRAVDLRAPGGGGTGHGHGARRAGALCVPLLASRGRDGRARHRPGGAARLRQSRGAPPARDLRQSDRAGASSGPSSPTRRGRARCARRPSGCATRCSARSRTICARRSPPSSALRAASSRRRRAATRPRGGSSSESIHQEASHLDRLVNGLLEMTRLESGAVTVKKERQALEEVVGAVLKRLERLLGDRPVRRRAPRATCRSCPSTRSRSSRSSSTCSTTRAGIRRPDCPIDISASVAGQARGGGG